jgi:hypothetical protein
MIPVIATLVTIFLIGLLFWHLADHEGMIDADHVRTELSILMAIQIALMLWLAGERLL